MSRNKNVLNNLVLPLIIFLRLLSCRYSFFCDKWLELFKNIDKPEGYWKVAAYGDSCIFHIRNSNLIKSFPLSYSSEFNNTPNLISSLKEKTLTKTELLIFITPRIIMGNAEDDSQFMNKKLTEIKM